MFGLGVPELVLILIIGLVIFGPGKLPDVGKALGKSIREFKSANKGVTDAEPPAIDVMPKDEAEAKGRDTAKKTSVGEDGDRGKA